MLQDKQDIKEYHNNFLIINSCKRGNLLCSKLIYYSSIYEEDKAMIHKLTNNCYVFYLFGRNKIWITEIKLYHLHLIQIANAILNHKQADIQNMEQSVDILKSGKL
jgi:hypothetical protein